MHKKKQFSLIIKMLIVFLIPCMASPVLADTLGTLSENLLGPTSFVTQMLVYACYIVGVVFFFMALAQYKIHRESPKLVPLTTPIMLAIFGAVLVLLPYFSTLFNSGSALEYIKKEGVQQEEDRGLPLPPLERPRRSGPGDFFRNSREGAPSDANQGSDQRAPSQSKSIAPSKSDRHWGEDLPDNQ
jgi:hypothetical protein